VVKETLEMNEQLTKASGMPLVASPSKRLHSQLSQTIADAKRDTWHDIDIPERRCRPRYPVKRPVLVVPVLPDGSPDWEHRQTAMLRDVSDAGVGLTCPNDPALETDALVLLVRGADGEMRCMGLEVRHQRAVEDGQRHIGALFGGFAADLMRPDNLMPRFQVQSLQFEYGCSEEVIARWAKTGLLKLVRRDRVQMCPRCRCLPSFRPGCVNCGSANLVNDTLIHHFACAHVGLAAEFENATGDLICPKCRQRPLIVGTDFEYATGPYRCLDCAWSDTEREQVAECLRCSYRFPGGQAHLVELRGYRAQLLDILALLPAHQRAGDVPSRAAAD
jgi:hypothetical protein